MLFPEHAVPPRSRLSAHHHRRAAWPARKLACTAPLAPSVAAEHDANLLVTPTHLLGTGLLCGADLSPGAEWPALRSACLSPATPSLIEAACREARAWQAATARPSLLRLSVALPIAPAQDRALAASIRSVIEAADLPAGALEVTLAEEDGADQSRELLLFISALRDAGAGVALDRLSRLQQGVAALGRLPLTAVRLHPSVVESLSCDAETRRSLRQTIRMAQGLGATTVALGVTTPLHRDILADMYCDEAQGPLYAPSPLTPSGFRSILALLP